MMQSIQEKPDYTVPDFAKLRRCSEKTIWRLIEAEQIPGVYRLGRLVRIHRATADAWVAAGCPELQAAEG